MKFLAGLLKTLSVLLLLLGTIFCTVVIVMVGIVDEQPDVILVFAGAWVCVLFVFFGILGTGIALSQTAKLKKRVERVERLEQHLFYAPAAPRAVSEVQAAPAESAPAAVPVQPAEPAVPETAAKKFDIKRWLPVIIAAALVVVALVLVLAIGGGEKNTPVAELPDTAPVTLPPVEMVEPETEAPAEIHAEELPMGAALSTGFVEMSFDEIVIQEDIQKSVTIDHVTRITGPEPLPGQVYICLSGIIKNTSTTELPVYDFFAGRFQIGEYQYEVSANDCDVLSADGSSESMIAPLMEYEYRIYAAIPVELAEMVAAGESYSFTFGFYENFDNQELAYNRAFGDDAIATCPYQYFVPFG